MSDLVHYSDEPIITPYSVAQSPEPDHKPRGLWLSFEDPSLDEPEHWAAWCDAESFPIGKYKHDVQLSPGAHILWLKSPGDIDQFNSQYRATLIPEYTYFAIDWSRVAREYNGIIIAPYQWERRFASHVNWYYTWDCASGCVWDAYAIASVTLLSALEQKKSTG